MENLTELRRELRKIGFGVKTKTFSFGKSATYYHIATGKQLKSNVYSADDLIFWKVLFDFRKANNADLKVIRVNDDCTGLI